MPETLPSAVNKAVTKKDGLHPSGAYILTGKQRVHLYTIN